MSAVYECWKLADIPEGPELVEGFSDAYDGAPPPGDNRGPAYHHGWWAGFSDKNPDKRPAWIVELCRQYGAAIRGKTSPQSTCGAPALGREP